MLFTLSPGKQSWSNGLAYVLCAVFTGIFFYLVFATYWPGPFVDYWIDIPLIEDYFSNSLSLDKLITAHNNVHRILIPRLLFIADYAWFQGNNTLLITVSILIKLSTLWLLTHILQQSRQLKPWLLALVVMTVFHASNIGNIVHSSNIQWDLVSLFSLLAIYFHHRLLTQKQTSKWFFYFLTSWGCFSLAFFSHAGSLSLLFVFVLMSLADRKWILALIYSALAIFVLYLTFNILPVREPDEVTYHSAVAILMVKAWYVALYVFRFFSATLAHYLGDWGLYFSVYISLGLLLGAVLFSKTRKYGGNIFLYFSFYLLLMTITIAASRVDFSPKTWWAVRYQTTALLLMVSVTLHLGTAVAAYLKTQRHLSPGLSYVGPLALLHGILMLCLIEPFTYKDGFFGSNKVFKAHANMLTFGVNQQNGAGILPSLQQYDRITRIDSLFTQHGFAYYSNKQPANQVEFSVYRKPGETLVDVQAMASFRNDCRSNINPITFHPHPKNAGFELITALDTHHTGFFYAMLNRHTYYVLDNNGVVQGFAYFYAVPEKYYLAAEIRAYVITTQAHYLAEIDNDRPVCLYALQSP